MTTIPRLSITTMTMVIPAVMSVMMVTEKAAELMTTNVLTPDSSSVSTGR
jgi:hypothetical protein